MPLVSTPFLIRAVGLEQFGMLEFSKAVSFYFTALVSYGFKYSATKQITLHYQDKGIVGQIISSVYAIQLIIIAFCLLILWVLVAWVPQISNQAVYLTSFFPVVIGSSLFPTFAFQGLDKIRWLTILNLIFKILFLGSILLFIHQPADAILFPLLLAVLDAIRLIVALIILYVHEGIPFKYPVWNMMVQQIQEGVHIFLSQLAIMFYARFSTIFLGLFVGPTAVTLYTLGDKIARTTEGMLEPAMQALYPISHRQLATSLPKGLDYIQRFTKVSLVVLVGIGIVYWVFADKFIALLAGTTLPEAVKVFKIHAPLPATALLSNIIGLHILIPLKAGNKYTLSILAAGILAVGLHFILVPRFQAPGAASAVLLSEIFTVSLLWLIAYREIQKARMAGELGKQQSK
jgi:PST family polysaccharide transporter